MHLNGTLISPQMDPYPYKAFFRKSRCGFTFYCPAFYLNGIGVNGRLIEDDIKLTFHLCQLRLNEDVCKSLPQEIHNEREIAAYPTVRSKIRSFSFQGDQLRFEATNLFQDRIPDRMIVGLVRNEAFSGNVAFHPFAFQNFGLQL